MDLKFDWGFNQDSKHFVRVCSWVSKKHNNKPKSGASPSEWAPLLCLNGWLLNCSTNKIILLWQIFWALLTEALSVSLTFKTRTHLCFLLLFYMKTTSPFLHFKQKTTFTALISSYQRCTHVNNYWTSSANHLMSFEKSFPESLSFLLMQYLEKKKSTTRQLVAFLSAAAFLFSPSTPVFRSQESHDWSNYRAVKPSCEMRYDMLLFSIFMSTGSSNWITVQY